MGLVEMVDLGKGSSGGLRNSSSSSSSATSSSSNVSLWNVIRNAIRSRNPLLDIPYRSSSNSSASEYYDDLNFPQRQQ